MSTSGSTNFATDRDSIIKGALRLVGAISQGDTPTTDQVNEASEALNMLMKHWMIDGMQLWALKNTSFSLTASTNTYRIGLSQTINVPKPLKIIQVFRRNISSNIDVPIRIISKQEYNSLSNKSNTGYPIQLYYDSQRNYGDIFLYLTPDATIAAAETIHIIYQRPFEDFDASTDEPDIPQEWFDPLKFGLATRIAGEYGMPIMDQQILEQRAKKYKDEALSFDQEEGSLYFSREYM